MREQGKKWAEWLADLEQKSNLDQNDTLKVEMLADAIYVLCREGEKQNYPQLATRPRSLRQAFYVAMRLDGSPHQMAEMLAVQTPPMSNTDREFLEGHCNGNQFEKSPYMGEAYKAIARKAGVDITGKVYMSGLATFPGDPMAWVGGRGDVIRVAEHNGMSVDGSVKVKARDLGPGPEDVGVADDIVWDECHKRAEEDPGFAILPAEEAFNKVRDEIKPHWAD